MPSTNAIAATRRGAGLPGRPRRRPLPQRDAALDVPRDVGARRRPLLDVGPDRGVRDPLRGGAILSKCNASFNVTERHRIRSGGRHGAATGGGGDGATVVASTQPEPPAVPPPGVPRARRLGESRFREAIILLVFALLLSLALLSPSPPPSPSLPPSSSLPLSASPFLRAARQGRERRRRARVLRG